MTFLAVPAHAALIPANYQSQKPSLTMIAAIGQQYNITSHVGDLILEGNDDMLIKDAQLDLNGSLLMSGNSTLVLDNGRLYPAFEKGQHSFIMHDNAKIIMRRGSEIVSGIFDFIIYDNALVDVSDSNLEKGITIDLPNATLHAVNSQIRVATVQTTSRIQIINSTAGQLLCHGDARVVDSHIESLVVAHNFYPIYVDLVNSTYDQLDTTKLGKGIANVKWYLMISVESQGTPLQGVNVQVYYAANDSLAAQQTTSSDGRVQFELSEWEITEVGNLYLGNYTVIADQGAAKTEANVTLNASKDVTVELPQETALPPELLLTALFVALIASVVVVGVGLLIYFKKRKR
jgi:hypothetical protein